MKDKDIEYIEVTEKRYNHVKTRFKYMILEDDNEKHYYLARNRWSLEDKLSGNKIYVKSNN